MATEENYRFEELLAREPEQRKKFLPFLKEVSKALEIEKDPIDISPFFLREYSDLLPGVSIFFLAGDSFERPTLPSGAFLYFAYNRANQKSPVTELAPRNSSVSDLLLGHWDLLPNLELVRLADFILTMLIMGPSQHAVLADMRSIDTESRREAGFKLKDEARQIIEASTQSTTLERTGDGLVIHALTLYGWMHELQDLGMTEICIARDGGILLGDRQTICEHVFSELPMVWY